MPEPRAFKDRPFRRVGVAALLAVAVHAVLIGAGAYLFGDYIVTDNRRPKLTQDKLERAIEDTPILAQSAIISGSDAWTPDADEPLSPGWTEARMAAPAWSWWSWEANAQLSAALVVPEKQK